MINLTLRALARAVGGDIVGVEVIAPGPGHSRKDRSLCIRPTAGGILVHSFAGDSWQECQDYVARQVGLETCRRRQPAPSPEQVRINTARDRDARLEAQREAERITFAVRLFNEAQGPCCSPVEAYLHKRKLAFPGMGAGEWVRFHPACPFAGERTPAMVCLVRDMRTDEPRATHRTALDRDGNAVEINALISG